MKKSLLATLLSAAIIVSGYIWWYRPRQQSSTPVYYGVYDNARGLQSSGAVNMQGVRIGSVERISLQSDQKILVKLAIHTEIPVRNGAKAIITADGLTGERNILLVQGQGAPLPSGSYLITGQDSSMTEIFNAKTESAINSGKILLKTADSTLQGFSSIVSSGWANRTQADLQRLNNRVVILEKMATRVAHSSAAISPKIRQTAQQTDSLTHKTSALTTSLANADRHLASLSTQDLSKNLISIQQQIESLRHTVQDAGNHELVRTRRPYQAANKQLEALHRTLFEIGQNPPNPRGVGGGKK